MWTLVLAAMLGGVQVNATAHKGDPASGELKSLDANGIVITTADGDKKLTLGNMKVVEFPNAKPSPEPHQGPLVELIDGSVLPVKSFTSKAGTATLTLSGGAITTSNRRVRAVLLKSQRNLPKLQKDWREIIDNQGQGDLAVVRRSRPTEGERIKHSLDQLAGVLYDIDEKEIEFGLEGKKRKVALEKLEGIVYFHSQQAALKEPVARVLTTTGAEIVASALSLDADSLKITSLAEVEVSIPLNELLSIRMAGGDVVYLSDLKPQSTDWRPYIPTRIGGNRLSKLYAPRFDEASDGGKLRLEPGGDVYAKGLSVHSRTELVYRLPAAFKRFQADVGLDPRFRNAGNVELIIKSESAELLRKAITPEQPRLEVDLEIIGARRLTIIVDFGEGWDVADYLNLCDARLSK